MTVASRTVEPDEDAIRLDRWFRRHYPGLTQGALQRLCRTGQIRVDGHRCEAATRLAPGQSVRVPPLPAASDAPPTARPADERDRRAVAAMTLWEDEDVLVLDKPPGLATQGGPGIVRHVDRLVAGLGAPGPLRPRLVHRLDRDTSGVLLLGKGPAAAGKLAAAFRGRDVAKTYWAVVVGRPQPGEGEIDAPLAKLGGGAGALTVLAERDDPDAAHARTAYRVLDAAGRRMSWLELAPLTGRTHQLRVHCEALGTPILGDPRYGGDRTRVDGFAASLHLHARALTFPHPRGGTVTVEAVPPPHMHDTFGRLGFHAPRARPPARTR